MAWYYFGLGHKAKETTDKAREIALKNKCVYKVEKTKDPIGGYLYKVYFSKKNVKR